MKKTAHLVNSLPHDCVDLNVINKFYSVVIIKQRLSQDYYIVFGKTEYFLTAASEVENPPGAAN